MMDKKTLRKELTYIRDHIDQTTFQSAPGMCMNLLREMEEYKKSDTVYIFLSFRSELNTIAMIEEIMSDGKTIAVPRVNGKNMAFYEIKSLDDCESGAWGILEPKTSCPLITEAGIMLLPGLGFDVEGGRIGYGGGFYDRYLEEREDLVKIGLCYHAQMTESVIRQEHDILMDYVLTEKKLFRM